ncbi:MAG: hypothetical protein ACFCU2_02625 [Acidimicrobiia bacterium]
MERIHESGDLATKDDVADLRTDMNLGFERVDARFEKLEGRFEKIDDRLYQFHETLRGYSRTFVTTQVASIIGAVGLAVGIIKFL